MPGPAKQPKSVSILRGTHQPCRDAEPHLELEPLTQVPEPPEWLSGGQALNCWGKRAQALVGAGVIAHVDLEFLGIFCQLEAKLIALFGAGELPHASMLTQYKQYANELAIGPASRQKFKPTAEKPKGNKFKNRGK